MIPFLVHLPPKYIFFYCYKSFSIRCFLLYSFLNVFILRLKNVKIILYSVSFVLVLYLFLYSIACFLCFVFIIFLLHHICFFILTFQLLHQFCFNVYVLSPSISFFLTMFVLLVFLLLSKIIVLQQFHFIFYLYSSLFFTNCFQVLLQFLFSILDMFSTVVFLEPQQFFFLCSRIKSYNVILEFFFSSSFFCTFALKLNFLYISVFCSISIHFHLPCS